MKKQRIDTLLVEKGLCPSRQQAQRLIRAGEVKVSHQIIDKPGTPVAVDAAIELKQKPPFVSRGGEKLARALKVFNINPVGRVCLDGGISTGGFTDCLLQAGAKRVYGVDVGYGQVAWKIRQDSRVVLKERTNIRHLTPEDLFNKQDGDKENGEEDNGEQERPTLGVMDVSFISLVKVLPAFWSLLSGEKEVVLLVKPQFEVGKDKIGKNGVVRDHKVQAGAIDQVMQAAAQLGWQYQGLTWSETVGPAGNIEYLLWLTAGVGRDISTLDNSSTKDTLQKEWPTVEDLRSLTYQAHQALIK